MNEPCYLCSHIFENTRPILFVSKADREWQFLCGQFDHEEDEVPHVVCIGDILERDASLSSLIDTHSGKLSLLTQTTYCSDFLDNQAPETVPGWL